MDTRSIFDEEHDMQMEPRNALTDTLAERPPDPFATEPLELEVDPVLALPLVAVALLIFFPILGKIPRNTTSISTRGRLLRQRLIGRTSVVLLPIAALVSLLHPIWPLSPFGRLWQGLLICAIVLIPLLLWHGIVTLKQARASERRAALDRHAAGSNAAVADAVIANAVAPDAVAPNAAVADVAETVRGSSADPDAPGRDGAASDATDSNTAERDAAESDDEEEPVDVQLARLAGMVDSHDLGESDRSLAAAREASTPAASGETALVPAQPSEPDGGSDRRSIAIEAPRAGIDTAGLRATMQELRDMKGVDVVRLVHALRVDRKKLQRLVVAQRAAHESERQSHERTRTVARDALRLAHANGGAHRLAEKATRRERRERLHVEAKYERVAQALRNAVSIVELERDGPADDDARDADETRGREGETSADPALP